MLNVPLLLKILLVLHNLLVSSQVMASTRHYSEPWTTNH